MKGWTEALMAKPDAMLRQRSIIQLACAAVHAFNGESSAQWAALEQHESHLLQQALDGMSAHLLALHLQFGHVSYIAPQTYMYLLHAWRQSLMVC